MIHIQIVVVFMPFLNFLFADLSILGRPFDIKP